MITKIEIDDQTINLNLKASGTPNIFDIDSISLVIGNNGSGKTTLLNKIISKFTPKSETDKYSCMIHLDSEKLLSFSEMRSNWGVAYYSPIPYGRRYHSTKNIIDASPKWGKPISAFDLQSYGEILESFGISPKVYASKTIDIKRVCRILIETLVIQSFPHIENNNIANLSHQLIEFIEDTNTTKTTLALESYSPLDIEEAAAKEKAKEKLEKKLIDSTASKLYRYIVQTLESDEAAFCFFSVLDYHIAHSRKENDLIRDIARVKLDPSYHNSSYNVQSRDIDKALNEIDKTHAFITNSATLIKLGSKATVEIELNPYEKTSPLIELGIDHLFDIGLHNMSSGQLAVIAQLVLISEAITSFSEKGIRKILLLLDEGDAFLHLEWQRKYIKQLNKMLAKLKNQHNLISLQLIMATHSPLLATDVPKQFICRMEKTEEDSAPSAFAAPLHSLINQSFGAKTIGEFASERIKSAVRHIMDGQESDTDRFIIESIDNPIIKTEIIRTTGLKGIES